ncbi:MAG: hypothetical protein IPK60_09290 [Sandaracinaceae bacterium]|nr:hypothetical protein [Sandaracinaceae bacterium]
MELTARVHGLVTAGLIVTCACTPGCLPMQSGVTVRERVASSRTADAVSPNQTYQVQLEATEEPSGVITIVGQVARVNECRHTRIDHVVHTETTERSLETPGYLALAYASGGVGAGMLGMGLAVGGPYSEPDPTMAGRTLPTLRAVLVSTGAVLSTLLIWAVIESIRTRDSDRIVGEEDRESVLGVEACHAQTVPGLRLSLSSPQQVNDHPLGATDNAGRLTAQLTPEDLLAVGPGPDVWIHGERFNVVGLSSISARLIAAAQRAADAREALARTEDEMRAAADRLVEAQRRAEAGASEADRLAARQAENRRIFLRDGVGGFRFGMSTTEGRTLCESLHGDWHAERGDDHEYDVTCQNLSLNLFAPPPIRQRSDIRAHTCAGRLCTIAATARFATRVANVFWVRVASVVTSIFGFGRDLPATRVRDVLTQTRVWSGSGGEATLSLLQTGGDSILLVMFRQDAPNAAGPLSHLGAGAAQRDAAQDWSQGAPELDQSRRLPEVAAPARDTAAERQSDARTAAEQVRVRATAEAFVRDGVAGFGYGMTVNEARRTCRHHGGTWGAPDDSFDPRTGNGMVECEADRAFDLGEHGGAWSTLGVEFCGGRVCLVGVTLGFEACGPVSARARVAEETNTRLFGQGTITDVPEHMSAAGRLISVHRTTWNVGSFEATTSLTVGGRGTGCVVLLTFGSHAPPAFHDGH